MTNGRLLILITAMLCATPAFAISNDDLRAALEQRFKDDRTGSGPMTSIPRSRSGSVAKTMTAALLAEFIARGEVTLEDPIAKLLPPGTS